MILSYGARWICDSPRMTHPPISVDAGKSSTLGVLTKGGLDDGRGKARVNLFRHKHEIESGRTSSVSNRKLPALPPAR